MFGGLLVLFGFRGCILLNFGFYWLFCTWFGWFEWLLTLSCSVWLLLGLVGGCGCCRFASGFEFSVFYFCGI